MTVYQSVKLLLCNLLEVYRYLPVDTPQRKYIDRLMDLSRSAAEISPEGKQYHNLLALRYITDTRPPVYRICEALHIGRGNYEAVTDNAIDRLLVLAFGFDGVDCGDGEV